MGNTTRTNACRAAIRGSAGAIIGLAVFLALIIARIPTELSARVLVGAAILVGVFVSPAFGLMAVGFSIPLGGLYPIALPGLNVTDLLVLLVALSWIARSVTNRSLAVRLPPLIWVMLAFVWILALSLTQAASWRDAVPEWFKWSEFVVVYALATQILDRRNSKWVLWALLAAGVGQAGFGAYQFFRQAGPEAFVLLGRFMRAYGSFKQPNPYAGFLGYLAPVAASLAIGALTHWWRHRHSTDLRRGLLYAAAAGLLLTGIIMSWSRGAWFGIIAAALVVIGARSRRTAAITGATVLVAALLITLVGTQWLPAAAANRLTDFGSYVLGTDPTASEITDANFSVLERLAHWRAGWRMFEDHPWLGVGIGNYAVAYAEYAPPHWYDALGHAHNIYVNFLAETGFLGGAAFLLVWAGIAWHAWRVARRSPTERTLAVGLLGTWCYLTVHGVFDNLFVQHMQLVLALLLGCLAVVERQIAPEGQPDGNVSVVLSGVTS